LTWSHSAAESFLMTALFDDPMVQAGVAPFVVALGVAAVLMKLRADGLPWLALVAALATTLMLTTGIGFTPLSASRKVLLLVLLAPALGLVLDLAGVRARWLLPALSLALGLASAWVFQSVLSQAEGAQGWITGGGVALFVALMVGLVLRLRDDGVASAGATLGLGVAVGVCAILSASLGTLMNGISLAVAGGALLLLQFVRATPLAAGWTGSLTTGAAAALFAAGTFMLAEARAWTLALMLLVPLVAGLPLFGNRPPRLRLALRGALTAATALIPIATAYMATQVAAS
jgi:hypothetical protein